MSRLLFRPVQRVTVVVLNFRTPVQTATAVRSVGASTRLAADVIVVDNGSGDESMAYLQQALPGTRVLQSGANLGFAGGCNLGIRSALELGADAVLLLNSDAELLPGALGDLCDGLQSADAGVAGPVVLAAATGRCESAGISYSAVTGRMTLLRQSGRNGSVPAPAREVDAVSGAAMLIRADVFARIGFLAEEYFYGFEDLDFCLRARRAGIRTVVVPRALVRHAGAASIGAASPRRVYFAARNHLLLAAKANRTPAVMRPLWIGSVIALNLASALTGMPARRLPAIHAVWSGTRDYFLGRVGDWSI